MAVDQMNLEIVWWFEQITLLFTNSKLSHSRLSRIMTGSNSPAPFLSFTPYKQKQYFWCEENIPTLWGLLTLFVQRWDQILQRRGQTASRQSRHWDLTLRPVCTWVCMLILHYNRLLELNVVDSFNFKNWLEFEFCHFYFLCTSINIFPF